MAEASTQSDANTRTKFFMNQALLFFYFFVFFVLFIYFSFVSSPPTEFLFFNSKASFPIQIYKESSVLKRREGDYHQIMIGLSISIT